MTRTSFVLMCLTVTLAVSACAPASVAPTSPSPLTSAGPQSPGPDGTATTLPTTPPSTAAPDSSATPEPPSSEPTAAGIEYRVTYDWAVPSDLISIPHTVQAPIAPPPASPLPYLVAIYVGDHPEADPKFQRISFYFRGTFPEYNFQYVRSVTAEGSGATIQLDGNSFLRLGFVSAQAHDNEGASTVKATPQNPIGFQNLKSYGSAGDFEGHVTYGLGLQVAPDSDQVLAIRAGELKKPDGAGGYYYIVHLDVMNG